MTGHAEIRIWVVAGSVGSLAAGADWRDVLDATPTGMMDPARQVIRTA